MSEPVKDIVPNFDQISFWSGTVMAFSEAVGFGVKQLALSSLYTDDELEIMLRVIELGSKTYGTVYCPEPDLLKSKLFPEDIAKDKSVVLIANNQRVLDEYNELKKLKEKSISEGKPEAIELDIARRFGKILSYDEYTIERLIQKNG